MSLWLKLLLIYYSVVSLFAVFITVADKLAARAHRRRVPESTLMTVGFFGGAVAMLITMKIIRHKTKHKKFMLGLPAEILLHIAIAAAIIYIEIF